MSACFGRAAARLSRPDTARAHGMYRSTALAQRTAAGSRRGGDPPPAAGKEKSTPGRAAVWARPSHRSADPTTASAGPTADQHARSGSAPC